MSSIADRNRNLLIKSLQGDPRIGDDPIVAAATLMRVSIFMMIGSGVVGLIIAQLILGEGMPQFLLGMVIGYGAYYLYLKRTMGEPRVVGLMAVLTNKKLVLLGSRKAGVVAEWKISEIESLDLVRRGNPFIMGKAVLTPVGGEPMTFLISQRKLGRDLVTKFQELHRGGH